MTSLTRSLSTRVIKKLEKPKPLKSVAVNRHSSSDIPGQYSVIHTKEDQLVMVDNYSRIMDDTMLILDEVVRGLTCKDYSNLYPLTTALICKLRCHGPQIEELHQGKVDKAFDHFRNGAMDPSLDEHTRLNLLQIIEFRASQWQTSADFNNYYLTKCPSSVEINDNTDSSVHCETCPQLLGAGEVLKSSGKYASPTRIPGKNYCKDEVVIRNADSGKVSPGVKERLVQITGPSEDKIIYAKQLMEETIKRNASPVRETSVREAIVGSNSSINSSASDESNRLQNAGLISSKSSKEIKNEYSYSVRFCDDLIHLSSTNLQLLNDAKLTLDLRYNSSEDVQTLRQELPRPIVTNNLLNNEDSPVNQGNSSGPKAKEHEPVAKFPVKQTYTRQFLLDCSAAKASLRKPFNWEAVASTYPDIVKQLPTFFDANLYQKRWLENEGKTVTLSNDNEDIDSE